MKRMNVPVIVFSVLLLVLGITQMTSADHDSQEKGKPSRVIRLIERAQAVSFQDANPSGPSLGDRLIFTSNLFDTSGNQVGRDGADCVTVRLDPSAPPEKQQIVQCLISVELFAEGQLTFQGLAQGTENFFAVNSWLWSHRWKKEHPRDIYLVGDARRIFFSLRGRIHSV